MEVRKDLTDEWQRSGIEDTKDFATLTDIMTKEWSGKTTREYKDYKGLKKENLRDHMTNREGLSFSEGNETVTNCHGLSFSE